MNLGDTFFGALSGGTRHLWVVITNPNSAGEVAIVNLTTRKPPCDDSCIVTPGEHPFVAQESIAWYRRATLAQITDLRNAVQQGLIDPDTRVSSALLQRLQQGAIASIYAKQAVQTAVQATLNPE